MDFKNIIAQKIFEAAGPFDGDFSGNDIYGSIETPPNPDMGDLAFPCYKLSKLLKKPPAAVAFDIAGRLGTSGEIFERIGSSGAYVNFYIDRAVIAREVITAVLREREDYGRSAEGVGKTVVVDYSSPNTAKHFHVGHLRSTFIGGAICNLYRFLGYDVVGINYLGDWGTQFGKLIVAYLRYSCEDAVKRDGLDELLRIYVKFHEDAENDSSLEDEARGWMLKMQDGDAEAMRYWKWFRDLSVVAFDRIYELLGVKFEYTTGESFYNDKMGPVVEELAEKNLLIKSDGAMIVGLEEFKMPPCLILRSDGGTLYPTRDIAAAKHRKDEFDFYKCLYLTGMEQNLHFAQWFKVVGLMGYDWADSLVHVPFGLINFGTGRLSTRKGKVVLVEPLLNDAIAKTREIIEQKSPGLADKDRVARAVGIGALKFNDLYNSRIKTINFSWERMLNFEGETGPYVQYTHARACSILRKSGDAAADGDVDFSLLSDECSAAVVKLMMAYGDKIKDAADKYEPYILARHLVDFSQAFNRFYVENPVLTADAKTKNARLALVSCVKTLLKTGLGLLGIEAVEVM